jgi:TRAP-type C4-dicarboxylate transport system permease small subunit
MAAVERLLSWLATALLWLGGIAILAMMVHVTADIVLKMVANYPIIGTLEIVSFVYMVACTFLPLAHVQLSKVLIVVELFTQKLPQAVNLRLDALGALLTAVYLGLMTWKGGELAIRKTALGEVQDATYFDLPVWPMRWVIVVSTGLAAAVALYQFADDLRLIFTGRRTRELTAPRLGDHEI